MQARIAARMAEALSGRPTVPLVAGLTFVPPDVLAGVAPGCGEAHECLASATRALALDFVFVEARAPWAEAAVAGIDAAVFWVVDGPLWPVLHSAVNVADGLMRSRLDPVAFAADLDDETQRAVEQVRRGVVLGVDAIVVADDLAGSDGLLLGPDVTSAEILPRLATIAGQARSLPALLHSDGDVRGILRQLAAAGFVGLHGGGGLDRDAFEALFWEAHRAGLVVAGGLPTSSLGRGTTAAVRAGTNAALLAQAGGLLLADDGGITTEAELGAFAAAVSAARGDGKSKGKLQVR